MTLSFLESDSICAESKLQWNLLLRHLHYDWFHQYLRKVTTAHRKILNGWIWWTLHFETSVWLKIKLYTFNNSFSNLFGNPSHVLTSTKPTYVSASTHLRIWHAEVKSYNRIFKWCISAQQPRATTTRKFVPGQKLLDFRAWSYDKHVCCSIQLNHNDSLSVKFHFHVQQTIVTIR